MSILNFNALDIIQQLKENLAQKDKEIIKLDKQDLSEQRDSIYKALEQAVKSLKIID